MDADTRQRRTYIRNAILSFVITGICIGIDIKSFYINGGFYMNWKMAVSFVLYGLLIFMGIRAIKKARDLKKPEE
ncbi:MAG: hypothetical protein K6G62_00365 [Eubacterium sp.]|nr:hypothetical protein [Eubacterium sp.]